MSNVEDESEYNLCDENRKFALSNLPMFLVKFFWVTTLIDHPWSWNVKANQDVLTEAENTIQAVSDHYI